MGLLLCILGGRSLLHNSRKLFATMIDEINLADFQLLRLTRRTEHALGSTELLNKQHAKAAEDLNNTVDAVNEIRRAVRALMNLEGDFQGIAYVPKPTDG